MTCVLQKVCCFAHGIEMKCGNPSEVTDKSCGEVPKSIPSAYTTRNELMSDVDPLRLSRNRTSSLENEATAVVSLKKALQMEKAQKADRARKLFHHALLLCPSNPDILASYGGFLENVEKDIIGADHFYERALTLCPQHPKATENFKRTRPLVTDIDEKHLSRISAKRLRLSNVMINEMLEKIQREDYFEHIHNTVAIEGNTLTLDEVKLFIETGVPIPGKSSTEHNEVLGIVDALQFVSDSLICKTEPITLSDILDIHNAVFSSVDPVNAGCLRKIQVYVGVHAPPDAPTVYNLMQEFCEWLNSGVSEISPVKLAALAHQKIAYIHPFVDGNGRTARLLMNLILMRAGYPSVVIRKEDIELYFNNLQIANEGDVRPFVRFIAQYIEQTLDIYYHAAECGLLENSETLKL